MKKERVDVRVEQELLEELDIIAQRSGSSRSGIIREAIASFVDEQKHDWNSSQLKVNIPNRLADRVDWAIINGDASNIDSVIEKSLEHWLDFKETYYLEKKAKLESIAAGNAKNDAARSELIVNGTQLARK